MRLYFIVVLISLSSCSSFIDKTLNGIEIDPPYSAREEAETLHNTLFVADLHADSLLWNRDLLELNTRGHVDLPRLIDGGYGIQVFTTVTKVPWWVNFESNPSDSDMISSLIWIQGWPKHTRKSLFERAMYQRDKLFKFIAQSDGRMILIASQADLDRLFTARTEGRKVVGAVLGIEGAHALDGKKENLLKLHNGGFRVIGLVHFFDNDIAGSAHGEEQYGLTGIGKAIVAEADQRCMIIDLAHASDRTIEDTLALVQHPVIVSHTGVRGTCDHPRNLTDDAIRAIVAKGGLIGIGLFKPAMCSDTIQETARAIRYVADLVGIEHVAVGSDFDGATDTFMDASGMVLLTEALMDEGFSDDEIAAIMGDNIIKLLRKTLCNER